MSLDDGDKQWIQQQSAASEARIDKRIDGIDKRLGEVDKRIGEVDKRIGEVDKRIGEVDKRIGEVEDRLSRRIVDEIEKRIDHAFEHFSRHILNEVGARFAEVNATLASIDARLKLQAGLIQAGSRAMTRFSEYSENSESRWIDLEKRVQAIERKLSDRDAA